MELVLEKSHEAWQEKEKGKMVDLVVQLGRYDRSTHKELDPTVNVLHRGWGRR